MSRLERQSFLGAQSEAVLAATTVGIVGLGGGGSHAAQQTGHAGIGGYLLVDPDHIDFGNTNRLIGGTLADVARKSRKTSIAARTIRALQPNARIVEVPKSWHEAAYMLKTCDVIIGAVDSYREREQLERFARRYLIPYIDIGIDVHELGKDKFLIAGQVILSVPRKPCLRCCGLITDERLQREAEQYGAAGGRAQVVWPNGVLASTAVGLLMQLVTPWHSKAPEFTYLEYDGNKGTVTISKWVEMLTECVCPHHPSDETGDPLFDIGKHRARATLPKDNFLMSAWRSLGRLLQWRPGT